MINKILTFDDLAYFKKYIDKNNLTRYAHHLWDRNDAILKWVAILKNIEELNIKDATICDIGSGDSIISSILSETNKIIYAIDHERGPAYPKANLIYINTNGLNFIESVKNIQFDLFIDSCSVVHFDKSYSENIFNNGCHRVGQQIYKLLKPNGYFLMSSDMCESWEKGEYIKLKNLIKIYENCGLTLMGEPDSNTINGVTIDYLDVKINIASLAFCKI